MVRRGSMIHMIINIDFRIRLIWFFLYAIVASFMASLIALVKSYVVLLALNLQQLIQLESIIESSNLFIIVWWDLSLRGWGII
jgi:hypothetical protein